VPEEERWAEAVKVINASDVEGAAGGIFLAADALKQKVSCYRAF